ncbi:MAG: hypothetical protein Unbinned2189contig1000_35 [Prokaryotic dsDNA virus sp.]|nr:MAG: hypothetical protein Unbinned2189contig1000_35 [Prokaryotic dsDNA virus sp.]|tara:strand:+ start:923 stop:1870 length:948 start_codon:yes stop_codon:yes gene_type:complete
MAYIGNPVDTAFTSLLKQDLTGASGTSLTLTHAVANANDIALYINNVRQEPTEAYTVNGTTVSLTGSVSNSDDIYVIYLARAVQTTVPSDSSVSTAKIADDAITTAKIANNAVTSAQIASGAVDTPMYTFLQRKEYTIASNASSNGASIGFFNDKITSSYNSYKILIHNFVPATNAVDLDLRFSVDNGSNALAHVWQQSTSIRLDNGTVDTRSDNSSTGFRIFKNASNSATALGCNASIEITGTGNTAEERSKVLVVRFNAFEFRNDGYVYETRSAGYINSATRTSMINAIFFITDGNGGNINTAVTQLYGLNES